MKPDKFIFLHIMKTGGTSLRHSLDETFGKKLLVDPSHRLDRLTDKGILRLHKSLLVYPKNYKDYEIIFGHFNYRKYRHLGRPTITILRDPVERVRSHYSAGIKRQVISLENFCKATANTMTFMTGGDLSKFYFVGIAEYYSETLQYISKIVDKQLFEYRFNTNANKMTLNQYHIETIKQYNQDDLKLYKEALKYFKGKIL